MMTDDRRPANRPPADGEGKVPSVAIPVKIQPVRARCCGDCTHFLVLNCSPDPSLYFCQSNRTKEELVPPIGWLRGPDAPSCRVFVPVEEVRVLRRSNPLEQSIEERFIAEPAEFIDVKTAAHLLHKSRSCVYNMLQTTELESVRVGGTVFIYRPSLVRCIRRNDAA